MINQNDLKASNISDNAPGDTLIQRVNLIKFVARPQTAYLSLSQILQICLLLIVLFFSYSLYGYWQQITIDRHITSLKSQYDILIKNIDSGRLQQIQDFEKDSAFYLILQNLLLKNNPSFTAYLETLATNCPDGLWLTTINIKKRTNTIIISGKSYNPNNIVQLMDNLNRTALFQIKPLFLAKIDKINDQNDQTDKNPKSSIIYNFILQTQTPVTEPKT